MTRYPMRAFSWRWVGAVAALAIATAAAAALADPLVFSEIPSYYQQLDFNLTAPSAWPTAAGGYANPAVYAAMPGGELQYFFDDVAGSGVPGLDRWALFSSARHLGFGLVHERYPNGEGTLSVTDYRLALSFGDRATSVGVGLGWSRGDTEQLGRTTVVQLGAVQRLGRYVSTGLVGTFSANKDDQVGLADIAVRPLGDTRLTVFGDLELPKGIALDNAPWSAGAMLEPVSGIKLVGRYFEDKSFAVSLAYTIGGDMRGGYVRASASPRFDEHGDRAVTTYGFRVGYPERNFLAQRVLRDRYYLPMNLKGPIVSTRYRFFDESHTLYDILSQLETVRTDPRVKGVALNLSGARMSAGNAWEIREKLAQLQHDGKHVVVYFDDADMTLYHLASVADRIVMDPEGSLVLPGYTMGRTFIASMLDRIGVGIDEWRFLKYKSAAEMLTRHTMSDADREQRQALVDQYYKTMRDDVAGSREVDTKTVDHWINDITLFRPKTAHDDGLVDDIGRWEDVKDVIADLEGGNKRYVPREGIPKIPSRRWGREPQIAVVYAIGACAMDSGIRARHLERVLHHLRDDRQVKAIVLRVNSPGGSPLASDLVAKAMKECSKRKPVIVSQGDVAASGGYWLSMYGDEIVAQPTTVTGSIGVIGAWAWDKGLGKKLGLEGDFVKAGKHADLFFENRLPMTPLGLPHRALTPDERERVIDDMKAMYQDFVDKVAAGRDLPEDRVAKIAQGRVWTGVQARENGLVDRLGGLETALGLARKKAGIAAGDEVQIRQYGIKGLFDIGPLRRIVARAAPGVGTTSEGDMDVESADAFLAAYDVVWLRQIVAHNGRAMCLLPPEYLPRTAGSTPAP